jgi:hypothetical protein
MSITKNYKDISVQIFQKFCLTDKFIIGLCVITY